MDRCRYKTLLRGSAKLISNSQYTNQNTSYLPLDMYTCYDNFISPTFTMSGASKLTGFGKYEYSGSPYTTLNMDVGGTGATGSTNNSVWNTSQSAVTLEYHLPYDRMSGYTGKFRSSVYKWDESKGGFVYPPVHQKTFTSFKQTPDLRCEQQMTATTFSAFFSLSGVATGNSVSYYSPISWYWFGQDTTRTQGALEPIWDGLYTAGTLTNYLKEVYIWTAGTFTKGGITGSTHTHNKQYGNAVKNGHIIPTNGNNVTNDGVTGNAGYWQDGLCYTTGLTWDLSIGSGLGTLTGGPKFVSATTNYHGYYTGFVTGNVYLYSACCQTKVVDVINKSELMSDRGDGYALESNDYLVKGSFVYSGDGTTGSCYLTSGVTYDTLIDDPSDVNYEGVKNNYYVKNLYYPERDFTFTSITNPPKPIIVYSESLLNIESESTLTNSENSENSVNIEFVVESLPVLTTSQSIYYLLGEPIGDISLSLNGAVLLEGVEYIHDKKEVTILVTNDGGGVNVETTDELVVSYVKGNGTIGIISESSTVPSTGVTTGLTTSFSQDILYSTFNYDIGTSTYQYYTEQPLSTSDIGDLSNLVVLVNGVRMKSNSDFYRSKTNSKLLIFNPSVILSADDTVTVYYLTNLEGQNNSSLGSTTKSVTWTISPPPNTTNGYFEVQVTSSADTTFSSYQVYGHKNYGVGKGEYTSKIGPFTTVGQKYLYRVVNNRVYIPVSGGSLTTTATSYTNKFDTDNPALLSY